MKVKRSDIWFTAVICIICAALALLPTGYEDAVKKRKTRRVKARVTAVDNGSLQRIGPILTGAQELTLKILSGKYRNRSFPAKNILLGRMNLDVVFREGDRALAILQVDQDSGKVTGARAVDRYRISIELILFVLFALFLLLFARWTGLKALLSFVFTALCIWKVLIPLFLKGVPPLPAAFGVVAMATTVIILLITGFTRKGLTALAGSITGVGLTTVFAVVFGHFFRVPGTTRDFSEMLLYSGFAHLRLTDIFLAGIFISAAGAVMDVAMDIAAAQHEIALHAPGIGMKALIRSGFKVAYPVIGTMTTTLLFAYSGSFVFVLMVFMSRGTPVVNILNLNYVAAELLHTLVGSFGLVLVAPVTAVIGGYVYTRKKPA